MSTRDRGLWLAWLLGALLWFAPLNTPHLFEPDEGRYAEIPREMVANGDYVTPRLNGIKYFEKPVLQYWATAGAFRLFGEHAWSVRLWPATCGFLGLLASWMLARRLYDARSAALAVIVQAGSLLYLSQARMATLDMSLSFGLQLSMCALALLAQQRTRPAGGAGRWHAPALLAFGVAVAVLSKGLVGLLIPGAVAALYMLWRRDWWLPLRAQPWWSLLALLLLAAPWFVLVAVRNPEFAHFFFVVQHFQRYLSSAGFDRYEPVWFFVPVVALGLLPWSTLLPGALRAAGRTASVREAAAAEGSGTDAGGVADATAMLLLWVAFIFVFFSLSQSKLIPYVLPLFPALAVLLGRHLAALPDRRFAWHLRAVAISAGAIALTLLLLSLLPAAAALAARAGGRSIAAFILAFLLLGIGAATGARCARRGAPLAAALAAALGSWLLTEAALLGADALPRMRELVELEQQVQPWIGNSTRFYCVNDYLQPLPFYWRRTCTLVGYRGELDFGLRQEPWRWIPNLQQFALDWQHERDALAVMRAEDYRQLAALGLPMRVIYTAPSLVAVVRQ